MRLLFVIFIGLIIHGSFFPWSFEFEELPANPLWMLLHSWPRLITRGIIRDVGVNLAVYFPLGLSGYVAFITGRGRWSALTAPVLIAFSLSVTVECLQLFQPSRICSIVDVICNTAGAAAGVSVAALIGTRVHQPWVRVLLRRIDVLLIGAAWLLWQLFPMFPVWNYRLLAEKLAVLVTFDGGGAALLSAFAGWLIVACILEALGGFASTISLLLLAGLIVPLRLFIHGRFVALPEIAGVIAAIALWRVFLASRESRVRVVSAVVLATLLARQLVASYSMPDLDRFVWVPFTASLQVDSLQAFTILMEKSFLYTAAVWVLWWSGMRLRKATAVVAVMLAFTEMAQICMPDRVPETTDALITVLAGAVFGIARNIAAEEMREVDNDADQHRYPSRRDVMV